MNEATTQENIIVTKISSLSNLPENFVSAAVLLDDNNNPTHAGIIVNYQNTAHLLHYTGSEVLLENVNTICYYNPFSFIKKGLVKSFLAHCSVVRKEARPHYGYFYCGSNYDSEGNFQSPGDMPEYMTCVGFCINVIQGFLEGESFIEYNDWTAEGNLGRHEGYINDFLQKVVSDNPNIDISFFRANLRRIYPVEYFAASYVNSLPVRKASTDIIIPRLNFADPLVA